MKISKHIGIAIVTGLVLGPAIGWSKSPKKSNKQSVSAELAETAAFGPLYPSVVNPTSPSTAGRDLAEENICPNNKDAKVDITKNAIEAKIQNDQKDFARIRGEVLAIKTKEQLDAYIKQYDMPVFAVLSEEKRKATNQPEYDAKRAAARANFEKLDDSGKFLVLQLRALAPFKSFFFRAKEYVKENSITRTAIVSMLRASAVGVQTFTQQAWGPVNPVIGATPAVDSNQQLWSAVFDYTTQPFADMEFEIHDDNGLDVFISYLSRHMAQISNDVDVVFDSLKAKQKSIWWDNRLVLAMGNFPVTQDQYIKIGMAEFAAIKSGLHLGTSALLATSAYRLTGFSNSIGEVSKLMGYDTALLDNGAEGITSKNRFEILRKYPQLFTLKGDDGRKRMQMSLAELKKSVKLADQSYKCILKRSAEDQHLFDVRFAQSMNRIALASISNIKVLLDSKKNTSTVIGEEIIDIDLDTFYNNPPEKLSDLYPIAYNDQSNGTKPEVRLPKELNFGKERVQREGVKVYLNMDLHLRNYKYESARAWNVDTYRKLFPKLTDEDIKIGSGSQARTIRGTTKIGEQARILSQTWGSAAFAIPLSAFVF